MTEAASKKELAAMQAHALACFANNECFGGTAAAPCKQKPIRSHTVAKRWLKAIAVNGHVYMPKVDMFILHRTGGKIEIQPAGINLATTHPLFCNQHDTALFQPIETKSFAASDEAAALLHFRALCRELLTKLFADKLLADAPSKTPDPATKLIFAAFVQGQRVGLRNITTHYEDALRRLQHRAVNEMRYYACTFDAPVPLAYAGAIFPEWDFQGERLEDLRDLERIPECLSVSCFTDDGKGNLVLAWPAGSTHCQQFAFSYHRLSQEEKSRAIATLAFEHFENSAISPAWWDAFDEPTKARLIHRMQFAGSPMQKRDGSSLKNLEAAPQFPKFDNWSTNEPLFNLIRY